MLVIEWLSFGGGVWSLVLLCRIRISVEVCASPVWRILGAGMPSAISRAEGSGCIVMPKKLETGLRTNTAGMLYTLLLRIEATVLGVQRLLAWGSSQTSAHLFSILRTALLSFVTRRHGSLSSPNAPGAYNIGP